MKVDEYIVARDLRYRILDNFQVVKACIALQNPLVHNDCRFKRIDEDYPRKTGMPFAFNISYANTPIGAQPAEIATGSNRGDTIGDKFGDLRI
jgi:hypothetical protein